MRRWLLRIFMIVLVLLVLLIAVVQGVLWSDLPRQVAVSQLQRQLGVSVRIDELAVGWFGTTEAHRVRVAAPLSADPVAALPTLRIEHTALPMLMLGRSPAVEKVTVDQPELTLRRDETGQWNVTALIEAVRAAQAGTEPTAPTGPLPLPALDVRGATIRLERASGAAYTLNNVRLIGRRDAALAYTLRVEAGALGQAHARFSRAAPHAHELRFDLTSPTRLSNALGLGARDYKLRGTWQGQLAARGLSGRLALAHARLARVGELTGRVAVRQHAARGAWTAQPDSLTFHPAFALPTPVTLAGGRLTWQSPHLSADALQVRALNGEARLNATFTPGARTGELHAAWEALRYPDGFAYTGALDVSLTRPGPAKRALDATVSADVTTPLGRATGEARLSANGRRWSSVTGQLRTTDVRFMRGGQTHPLPDLRAELALNAPVLRLRELTLRDAPSAAQRFKVSGRYDWRSRAWAASLDVAPLPLPMGVGPVSEVEALRVDATGQGPAVQLQHARLSTGGIVVTADGRYDARQASPVALNVQVEQVPIRLGHAQRAWVRAANLTGGLRLEGALRPLKLNAQGELVARSLQVYRESVGDLALTVHATADAQRVRVQADRVQWLGGAWLVKGAYPYDGEPRVTISGEDVDLSLVDGLLGRRLALAGRGDLNVQTVPTRRVGDAPAVTGEFELRDVKLPGVPIDRFTGKLSLSDGRFRLTDLAATRGEGRFDGALSLPLDEPTRLRLDAARFENWPALFDGGAGQVRLSGRMSGEFDVAAQTGDAQAKLRARATWRDQAIAALQTQWQLRDALLSLQRIDGELLGGTLRGEGRVTLGAWQQGELNVRWQDVQPARLQAVTPGLNDVQGGVSGSVSVGPADERRAIGPVRVSLRLNPAEATYRGLALGSGRATAYLDPARQRYVLHDLTLHGLGGTLNLWGRASRHPGRAAPSRAAAAPTTQPAPMHEHALDDEAANNTNNANAQNAGARAVSGEHDWYVYVQGGATQLDLARLTERLGGMSDPIAGRVDGQVTVMTPLHDWSSALGRGRLKLRESDLGDLPVFSILYDLMNVRIGEDKPTGRGDARFRIEQGTLVFDRFHYVNRGTQIELAGRLDDLWAGESSPIRGYALLSVTPLPDIELLETFNEALTTLQADVTTVYLAGTLGEPTYQLVPFKGVQDLLSRVLSGSRYEPATTQPGEAGESGEAGDGPAGRRTGGGAATQPAEGS